MCVRVCVCACAVILSSSCCVRHLLLAANASLYQSFVIQLDFWSGSLVCLIYSVWMIVCEWVCVLVSLYVRVRLCVAVCVAVCVVVVWLCVLFSARA